MGGEEGSGAQGGAAQDKAEGDPATDHHTRCDGSGSASRGLGDGGALLCRWRAGRRARRRDAVVLARMLTGILGRPIHLGKVPGRHAQQAGCCRWGGCVLFVSDGQKWWGGEGGGGVMDSLLPCFNPARSARFLNAAGIWSRVQQSTSAVWLAGQCHTRSAAAPRLRACCLGAPGTSAAGCTSGTCTPRSWSSLLSWLQLLWTQGWMVHCGAGRAVGGCVGVCVEGTGGPQVLRKSKHCRAPLTRLAGKLPTRRARCLLAPPRHPLHARSTPACLSACKPLLIRTHSAQPAQHGPATPCLQLSVNAVEQVGRGQQHEVAELVALAAEALRRGRRGDEAGG